MAARSAAEIVDELLTLPPKTQRDAAGAQGREPQGRVPRGVRGGAQGRLRARAHRRRDPAPRGRHRARQEEEAHDRDRDRPRQHRRRRSRAPDRLRRDRAARRRRHRAGRGRGRGRASAPTARRAPARAAASACPSCRRSRSRSTARSACASTATASARSWRSIPTWSSPTPTCRSRDGAIEPWGERVGARRGLDRATSPRPLSREFGIPLDKPWKKLTPRQREIVLLRHRRASASRSAGTGKHGGGLVGDALRGRRQQHQAPPAARPAPRRCGSGYGTLLPRAALPRLQGPAPAARVARGVRWPARASSTSRR